MILFKWGYEPETRKLSDGKPFPCEAFRWTLQVSPTAVEVVHQHKYPDSPKWHDSHTLCYGFGLHPKFDFGISHIYYDGPHCGLSLGWFRVFWGGDPRTGWCTKCMPED